MTYVGQPSLDVEHLYNTHNKCYSNKPGLNWINLSKVSPPNSRTHLLVSLSVPRYLRKIWTLLIGHLTSVIAAMWFISNFCISCINIFSSYDTVLTLVFKIISRATCNFFFRNIQNYLLQNLQGESLHLVYILEFRKYFIRKIILLIINQGRWLFPYFTQLSILLKPSSDKSFVCWTSDL